MLDLTMSTIWLRLRFLWRPMQRIRSPKLPESEHLRRDINLPPPAHGRHWWDLMP